MKKKLTTVDFRGTAEQEAKLLEVIAKYDGVKGKLMPILQEAQEIYGYLPVEVQKIIAEKTGTPAEQIYGDDLLHLGGQVTVDLLRLLQDGHQLALDAVVPRDDLEQLSFLLGSTAEIDRSQLLLHNF